LPEAAAAEHPVLGACLVEFQMIRPAIEKAQQPNDGKTDNKEIVKMTYI